VPRVIAAAPAVPGMGSNLSTTLTSQTPVGGICLDPTVILVANSRQQPIGRNLGEMGATGYEKPRFQRPQTNSPPVSMLGLGLARVTLDLPESCARSRSLQIFGQTPRPQPSVIRV
jgi:hypothetical protein